MTDKSVVVYLSEQGNSLPFAKWTCYDAGVHSACIVRWPGVIKPASVSDALVEYVDIVPTFVDIAGGKPQAKMDGESFKPVLTGKKKEHKNILSPFRPREVSMPDRRITESVRYTTVGTDILSISLRKLLFRML